MEVLNFDSPATLKKFIFHKEPVEKSLILSFLYCYDEEERMSFINKYLRNFMPYKVASHKIWNIKPNERGNILKLDWNEATIPPSPEVATRLKRIVNDEGNFYNYYPSVYNEDLMRLLSDYTGVPQKNIQYFASSDSLHEYIAKLYITVGDPILICGPSYDNFRLTAEVCGADIYYYNMDERFVFDEAEFEHKIGDINPSLIYICNPNNPTGNMLDSSYIENLLIRYTGILFLIDEAYAEFSGISAKELVLRYENIIISRTMSKAFAMANFRFGYMLASESNIKYISSIRNPKNITTFAQEAAIGALSDIPYMEQYVDEVSHAKKQFLDFLDNYTGVVRYISGGGNFVLLLCNTNYIKSDMIAHLEDSDIFVRDLSQTEYLKNHGIRITIGTREQMSKVQSVLLDFFERQGKSNGKTGNL